MKPIRRVLIVGGGIGGLSLAVALGRRGIQAEIVEIKSEHKVYGVGIIQPGNALRALNGLGLMERCLAEGLQIDYYEMNDSDGRFIARMKLLRIASPDIPAVNGLPRMALHRILTEAATAVGARIRLGLSVQALEQAGDEVDVTLTDGSREKYDLVVGADGIRSRIRTLLFGGQFDPQYTGHGVGLSTILLRHSNPTEETSHEIQNNRRCRARHVGPVRTGRRSPTRSEHLLRDQRTGQSAQPAV